MSALAHIAERAPLLALQAILQLTSGWRWRERTYTAGKIPAKLLVFAHTRNAESSYFAFYSPIGFPNLRLGCPAVNLWISIASHFREQMQSLLTQTHHNESTTLFSPPHPPLFLKLPSMFRRARKSLLLLCLFPLGSVAQVSQAALPDAPTPRLALGDDTPAPTLAPASYVLPIATPKPREQWTDATRQYFEFLTALHAFRLTEPKTRDLLGGPFFPQWQQCITSITDGWNDGDGVFTNNVMHPAQGSVYSYIYLQNHSRDSKLEFENSRRYWNSRFRAAAFSFAASTQFEIGPFSEATIGHVGVRPHTQGLTDFVMTPVGGFGLNVLQDWVDKRFIEPKEPGAGANRVRFWRTAANPARAIANVLRRKTPWYRDSRPLIYRGWRNQSPPESVTEPAAASATPVQSTADDNR